jgi:hypothetical protein
MKHYQKEEYKQRKFDFNIFQLEENTGGPIAATFCRRLIHHQLHRDIVETGLLLPLVNIIELYLVGDQKRENREIFIDRIDYFDPLNFKQELKLLDQLQSLSKTSKTVCSNTLVEEIVTDLILLSNNPGVDSYSPIYGDKISIISSENILAFYWNGTSASSLSEICCFDFPSFYWNKTSSFDNHYGSVKYNEFVLPILACSHWRSTITTSFQTFDLVKLASLGIESSICLYQLKRIAEYKCHEIGDEFFYFIALDYKVNNLVPKKIEVTIGSIRQNLEHLCNQAGQYNQEDKFFKLMNRFKINPHRLFFVV